jgi:hypothetical protein
MFCASNWVNMASKANKYVKRLRIRKDNANITKGYS